MADIIVTIPDDMAAAIALLIDNDINYIKPLLLRQVLTVISGKIPGPQGLNFSADLPLEYEIGTSTIKIQQSSSTKDGYLSKEDWIIFNNKQILDSQIEVDSDQDVNNVWNGKTILFTSDCTITVPSSLDPSLMFPFRTLSGVTVTWAITSPFTWESLPVPTTEKTTGHFMRRGNTNTIMLDV